MLLDKVVVITGAKRGIGEAIVDLFLKQGASVINGDISCSKSDKLIKKTNVGSGVLYESCLDIADKKMVNDFFEKVITKFGRIDILINNAGICMDIKELELMDDSEWETINEINFMGTVNCITATVPHMKSKKEGRIINLASIAGQIGGTASSIAYSVSKAGIICLTKVLAKSLGPEGITVNSIAPGFIITEMTITHVHDLSHVPLRRRGDAIDVANAALFLASNMGSYITGTTIDVNGGAHMN